MTDKTMGILHQNSHVLEKVIAVPNAGGGNCTSTLMMVLSYCRLGDIGALLGPISNRY